MSRHDNSEQQQQQTLQPAAAEAATAATAAASNNGSSTSSLSLERPSWSLLLGSPGGAAGGTATPASPSKHKVLGTVFPQLRESNAAAAPTRSDLIVHAPPV